MRVATDVAVSGVSKSISLLITSFLGAEKNKQKRTPPHHLLSASRQSRSRKYIETTT